MYCCWRCGDGGDGGGGGNNSGDDSSGNDGNDNHDDNPHYITIENTIYVCVCVRVCMYVVFAQMCDFYIYSMFSHCFFQIDKIEEIETNADNNK
jgi:hypothetical protein